MNVWSFYLEKIVSVECMECWVKNIFLVFIWFFVIVFFRVGGELNYFVNLDCVLLRFYISVKWEIRISLMF